MRASFGQNNEKKADLTITSDLPHPGLDLVSCLFVLGVTRPIMHAAVYSLEVRTTPREPARCGDEDRRARRSSARAVSSAGLLVCFLAPR